MFTEAQRGAIYEEYRGKILGYVRSHVNDPDTAEDICSDIFLKVYQKLDSFDETKATLSTWIYTIARNTLTDHYRVRRVHEEIPETLSDGSSFEEDICQEEMLETLAKALQELDERSRDIIILHYYSALTLKEVAQRIGLSYSHVKALHGQILEKLKKYF